MNNKPLAAIIGVVALLAACGGGDDENASKIASKLISEASQDGMKLDAECVAELAGNFSDADAALLVENLDNEDFDLEQLSADGQSNAMRAITCADKDALVDMMMDEIGSVPGLDSECVRGVFEEIDADQLVAMVESGGSDTGDLQAKMMACVSGG